MHYTALDIDTERDKVFHDLEQTGDLSAVDIVNGFHQVLEGRNGDDQWHSDARILVRTVAPAGTRYTLALYIR